MKKYFFLAIIFLLANNFLFAQNGKNFSDSLFCEKTGENKFLLKFRTQQNFDTIFVYELHNSDGFGQRKISSHPNDSSGIIFPLDTVEVAGQRSFFVTLKRKNFPEGVKSNTVTIVSETKEEIEMEDEIIAPAHEPE